MLLINKTATYPKCRSACWGLGYQYSPLIQKAGCSPDIGNTYSPSM
jgi:hypothetical protein